MHGLVLGLTWMLLCVFVALGLAVMYVSATSGLI